MTFSPMFLLDLLTYDLVSREKILYVSMTTEQKSILWFT